MRSFSLAVILVAVASAQEGTIGYHAINRPENMEVVPACTTFEVAWTPSDTYSGPVTFQLISGDSTSSLVPAGDMFGSVNGSVGSYLWDVPCDEGGKARYGLMIFQAQNTSIFQYSMPFQISMSENMDVTPSGEGTATPDPTYIPPMNQTTTTTTTGSSISTHSSTTATSTDSAPTEVSDEEPESTTASSNPDSGAASRLGGSMAILALAAAAFTL